MRRGGVLAARWSGLLALALLLSAGCVKTETTSSTSSTLDKYFGGPADTVKSYFAGRINTNTSIDFAFTGASHATGSTANADLFWDGGTYLKSPNKTDGIRYLGPGLSSTAFGDVAGTYTSSATINLGGVYGVKTVEGKYAQFYIKSYTTNSSITYDYAYQDDGGTKFQ